MYSAVVMAGKSKPQNLITGSAYRLIGEKFITDYKHTLGFTVNGVHAPLIAHVVRALQATPQIDDIIIVGDVRKLQSCGLQDVRIYEQQGSILENAVLGYSGAMKLQSDKCLFLCGDTPYVTAGDIQQFLSNAERCTSPLVFGLVEEPQGFVPEVFSRRYFPVIEDTPLRSTNASGQVLRVRHANAFFGKPTTQLTVLRDIYQCARKMLSPFSLAYLMRHYPGVISQVARGYLGGSPVSGNYVRQQLLRRGCDIDFAIAPHAFERDIDSHFDLQKGRSA